MKLEDIEDEAVNKEKSGIEPKYDDENGDDISCSKFIPLKEKDPKYSDCNVNLNGITRDYINKEFNVSLDEKESKLTIHDIDPLIAKEDEIIILKEYEDSTKLNEIINKITKFTKPIPDDKCLEVNNTEILENEKRFLSYSVYNGLFYKNEYQYNSELDDKYYEFNSDVKEDKYYYSDVSFNKFARIEGI